MPYALNIKKGTKLHHDDVGELPGSIAVPVTEEQAQIAKHMVDVVVFDRVAGQDEKKVFKGLYGIEQKMMKPHTEEIKKYTDFVAQHKDVKIASQKWKEYQEELRKRGVNIGQS